MESCQGYGPVNSTNWSNFYELSNVSFSYLGAVGRSGPLAFVMDSISGSQVTCGKRGSNRTTGVIGMAIQFASSYPTAYAPVVSFTDAEFTTSWGYTTQLWAGMYQGNWRLQAGSTVLATTSSPIYTDNNWHYVELVATIATGTGGSASLWIDGVQVLSVTGVNTAPSGNAYYNTVAFWATGTANSNVCDMYALDTTGSSPWNARLGDVKVYYKSVTGNGATNNFTPQAAAWAASTVTAKNAIIIDSNGNVQLATTAGTTGTGSHPTWSTGTLGTTADGSVTWTNQGSPANWKYVSNLPPNDAQAYLSSGTVSQIDMYAFSSLSATTQPIAVGVTIRGYKDQTYNCTVRAECTSSGTSADNGTDLALPYQSSAAIDLLGIFETDPHTSAQWSSVSAINSATFGVKVTAV